MAFRDPFMNREDLGTEEADVIIGGLGNDVIRGGAGDDVLGGLTGRDKLDGGEGNDVIDGGVGDDLMVGGSGNDTIIATEGDDTINGGSGDDHYVINGTAGDHVLITDTSGECDTMDARGAITSAIINMGAGERSYVDGRVIELSGGEAVTLPLDLAMVQDLSGSFDDDLPVVQGLLSDFYDSVKAIASDLRIGVSSYIDKPTSPFGIASDHEFRIDQMLSPDKQDLIDAYDALTIGNGNDTEESQLTALQQIALRAGEFGWGAGLRVAVLFTDAPFHEAGDFASVPANNGDTILDGSPAGTGEDYPSVLQVAEAMNAEGIDVVFAVTSDQRSTYEQLVADLGFGEVVTLSADSSDLITKVTRGVKRLTTTEIEKAIGGDFDDEINGNSLDNIIRGRGGDDEIEGAAGADTIYGGEGDDDISGGKGDDSILGGKGEDTLNGGSGKDHMNGGEGDDDLRGAGGNDTMNGNSGDDVLRGGSGSDTLNGGEGDDLLDGQGKSDCFVFDGAYGNDTIDGYSPSGTGGADDQMFIEDVASLSQFLGRASQDGDDVLYVDGARSIRLLDVELEDISAADFKFDEETPVTREPVDLLT